MKRIVIVIAIVTACSETTSNEVTTRATKFASDLALKDVRCSVDKWGCRGHRITCAGDTANGGALFFECLGAAACEIYGVAALPEEHDN
jgi:hypothetical protein